MSKVSKEISCIVGEYRNSEGQTKKRYQRIGSIIETKNGPMLKLDSIPLREGGWCPLVEGPIDPQSRVKSRFCPRLYR